MTPKKKRKIFPTIAIIVATFIALPFVSYPLSYQPSTMSQAAYQDGTQYRNHYGFTNNNSTIGVIYYPGGLVNPRAYASFAKLLHEQTGFDVYVTQPLFNLAITSMNQANQVMNDHPQIQTWFMGGHSLGGSSAAFYAIDHLDQIAGLFFLASYTTAQADFSQTSLPILTVTASEDHVLNIATYEAAKTLLSNTTTEAIIQGGNHGQFGSYGPQRGDGLATISEAMQHEIISTLMTTWMTSILPKD